MAHVLFVCRHNAGRSQISQALFERAARGRHAAASAGTTPARGIHPEVLAVMGEVGLDLSGRRPRRLDRELALRADVVITMGCGDRCPVIPGRRYLDWDLPDPRGRSIEEVRALRDEIGRRVIRLVEELDSGEAVAAGGGPRRASSPAAGQGDRTVAGDPRAGLDRGVGVQGPDQGS